MFDIGWSEIGIIAVIALFVIGPRELPKALRTMGHYVGKVRAMAREFQSTIDEAVRDTELEEVKNQIQSVKKLNVNSALREAIDPKNELANAFDVNASQPTASGGDQTAEPDPTQGSGAETAPSIEPPAAKPAPSAVWPVKTEPPGQPPAPDVDAAVEPEDPAKSEQNAQTSA